MRRSAAEEARTLAEQAGSATLATVEEGGAPWASLVACTTLPDGTPVLLVSSFAEHGRNLARDPRASLCVAEPAAGGDVLERGRVTLAGAVAPGDEAALRAFCVAHPSARRYAAFADFTCWVLRVDRARWVGGYARMDTVDARAYRDAEPDPVAGDAAGAARHLTDDHADALLLMAQRLGGVPDAELAACLRADRYGLDLQVTTPRGEGEARVCFARPCAAAGDLRAATVELARRARGA